MKKGLFAAVALSMGMLFAVPSVALADGITMNGTQSETGSVVVDEGNSTITVSGQAALSGTGDAFVINEDASLVFSEGATLTLTGYNNAFVVENATLSGGGWNIIDGDGMDLFRLKTNGKLSINGAVTLDGAGNTNTTSRAVVLPSGSGQAVTLQTGGSLAANDFFRGMETGGASGYIISGQGMDSSIFDFRNNDCGIALSYFDSNVKFADCKLEVSNCLSSGIFMRQDNASINGLYLDNVYINCVNNENLNQKDIAVRFHSVNFQITDSVINIQNAWNTGLWICDGWDKAGKKEITNTLINVNNVFDGGSGFYYSTMKRKAITLVPYGEWTIDGCTISMNGRTDNIMEGGLNVAADIKYDASSLTARPSYVGGKIVLKNSSITTSYINGADIGAQVGQYITIGDNVMVDNGHSDDHFTVLCDDPNNKFPLVLDFGFGPIVLELTYDVDDMPDAQVSKRVEVVGGSYWSTRNEDLIFSDYDDERLKFYSESVPVNQYDDELDMVILSPEEYANALQDNGALLLTSKSGETYDYFAQTVSTSDSNRYIWAQCYSVSFVYDDGTVEVVEVPCGWAVGAVAELPDGNWAYSNGDGVQIGLTNETVPTSDITVELQ